MAARSRSGESLDSKLAVEKFRLIVIWLFTPSWLAPNLAQSEVCLNGSVGGGTPLSMNFFLFSM